MLLDTEVNESTDEEDNEQETNPRPISIEISQTNEEGIINQMLNGDLAEADQSRLEIDDGEEEGAVGGILNMFETNTSSVCKNCIL